MHHKRLREELFLQEKMRLTTQMQTELRTIEEEVRRITKDVDLMSTEINQRSGISFEIIANTTAIISKLIGYKTRVENILCETDIKEQAQGDFLKFLRINLTYKLYGITV